MMASTSAASRQEFSQVFYDQLKCFNCSSSLKAGKHRWYKCFAFHLICQDCKEVKGYKKCSCNKPIASESCGVIEALLNTDTMRFKCENLIRGCQETSGQENMIFHQDECIFRVVKCPRIFCKSHVPFHELLEHMEQNGDHSKNIRSLEGYGAKMGLSFSNVLPLQDFGMREFMPIKIVIDKATFFVICLLKIDAFYQWIHYFGPPCEARNFTFTLEYVNNDDDEFNCSFSGRTPSSNETSESIIENGNCYGIPRKMFEKKFIDPDDNYKFKYFVTIRSLKEEVKDENVESGVSDVDE